MVQTVNALKRMRETLIGRNPVAVTISRETRTPNSRGGTDKVKTTVGPYDVRIVQRRVNVQTTGEQATEPGNIVFSYRYAAVFEAGADVRADGMTVDEFDAPPYGRFIVREVVRQRVEGADYGLTAELERIG